MDETFLGVAVGEGDDEAAEGGGEAFVGEPEENIPAAHESWVFGACGGGDGDFVAVGLVLAFIFVGEPEENIPAAHESWAFGGFGGGDGDFVVVGLAFVFVFV